MDGRIFVFGSNEAGRHGKGAALDAKREYGAVQGRWYGLQGQSFAIPTKDERLRTLDLKDIKHYVNMFIVFAMTRKDLRFNVTRIGCGLAGYTDGQIAPMFRLAPENCDLPEGWREICASSTASESPSTSTSEDRRSGETPTHISLRLRQLLESIRGKRL